MPEAQGVIDLSRKHYTQSTYQFTMRHEKWRKFIEQRGVKTAINKFDGTPGTNEEIDTESLLTPVRIKQREIAVQQLHRSPFRFETTNFSHPWGQPSERIMIFNFTTEESL